MAINDIPVRLDKAFFVSVASDFQKARETDDSGRETGREVNRENYDGDSYALDIQISAYVEERGMRALTSQAVTLEVPIEKSDEVLKRCRRSRR
ncbi:hypothetical protein JS562_53555 [Agrobacterium sp. S2]|nr:hypothetical protein [Agrobacterium sp. S2]